MKTQIVFDEKEFKELPLTLAKAIWEAMQEGDGYQLIARDDGKECTEFNEFWGFVLLATDKVLRPDQPPAPGEE